jgi:hypothetical protein
VRRAATDAAAAAGDDHYLTGEQPWPETPTRSGPFQSASPSLALFPPACPPPITGTAVPRSAVDT